MKRRTLLLVAVLAAAIVIAAVVLVIPRTVTETATVTISSESSPPWTAAFCVPEGTVFSYSWHTGDGSTVSVVLSRPATVGPPFVESGSQGNGSLYSTGITIFTVQNATAESVVVTFDLSYSATVNYLSSPVGHSGDC